MAKGLNPFFQIQSLRDFNQKFDPEWVPRSIVIDDVSDLPRVAMLYASVEGFLDVPVLSRVLEPPIRQRVEAEAAAGAGGAGWRRASCLAISRTEISSRTSTPIPKTPPNWDSTKTKTRVTKIETSRARVSQR